VRQRLPATTADEHTATRLRDLEQRVAQLERQTTVRQVSGWGTNTLAPTGAPEAPFGSLALDTGTWYLWLSVGSQWYYVAYVGP